MKKVFLSQVEMNERLIKAMIVQGGIKAFVAGINNALYHGEVFDDEDCPNATCVSEKHLSDLYDHIDAMNKIADEIEKE